MDVASGLAYQWLARLAQDLDTRVAHDRQDELLIQGRSPWVAHAFVSRALCLRADDPLAVLRQAHTLAGRPDLAQLVFSPLGWRERMKFVVERVLVADYPVLSIELEELSEGRATIVLTERKGSWSHDWQPVARLVACQLGAVSGCYLREQDIGPERVRVVVEKEGARIQLRAPAQATLDAALDELRDEVALWEDELRVGQRLFGRLVGDRVTAEHPLDAAAALQWALDVPGVGPSAVDVGTKDCLVSASASGARGLFSIDYALHHGGLRVGALTVLASGASDFVRACAPAVAADLWRHTRYRAQRLAGEREWTALETKLLEGVVAGKANKEMAYELDISESHVANTLTHLKAALGNVSRQQLAEVMLQRPTLPLARQPAPSGVVPRLPAPGAIKPERPPWQARPASAGMFAQVFDARFRAWQLRLVELERMRSLALAAAASLDEATGLRPASVEEPMLDCTGETRRSSSGRNRRGRHGPSHETALRR